MASRPAEGGRVLGGFVLGQRIAVGGMSEVFEARRADGTGPPLVVKVLLPQYSRDPETVRTLEHEAEIAATLAHPAIVRVVAFGTSGGETWLAMERVQGGTLADLTAHAERVSVAVALHVGMELLDGLGHVHEAQSEDGAPLGIVHRDVTPQNVLISRAGDVKLGDFGIARSAKRGGRTRTGVIKGKLAYLAPEQATGSALDARTDLYAAGVVIWELLTGRPWLEAETEIELLRAAEDPPFRAPSTLADIPVALDAVMERALRRFPEERFATARAMREALARAIPERRDGREELAALAVAAFGPAPQEAIVESGAAPRTRARRARVAVVGVIGVGVVAAAGWAAWGAAPEAAVVERREPPLRSSRGLVDPDGSSGTVAVDAPTQSPGPSAATMEPVGADAGRSDERSGRPRRPTASKAPQMPRDAGRTLPRSPGPAITARRDALDARLRARGIRRADVLAPLRTTLSELDRAIDAARWDEAEQLLSVAESSAAEVRVDTAFIRRKLDRVGALVAAARRAGANTRELEDLVAGALQLFLDGRLEETNARLDQIEGQIPRSR